MAVVWHKIRQGRTYEVRCAGRTRRLYVDGVLHSQYNPRTAVTGSVWDLLMLPALLTPVRRALILGLGGGAVVHLLRQFVGPRTIVAVEIDPLRLAVARRFFAATGRDLRLHLADAAVWAGKYRGPPFDLVVDDVFGEQDGQPIRGIPVTRQWTLTLYRMLARSGSLVVNFPHRSDLLRSAVVAQTGLKQRFACGLALSTPCCENAVGVFSQARHNARTFRRCIGSHEALAGVRSRLRFRVATLW